MSVIAFRGRDPVSEARALLHCVLRDADVIGTDEAGRTALLLLIDPWTLERLLTYDAGTEDLEDAEGEPEPDRETDGPATVLDFVPPKRFGRVAQAVALALPLMVAPQIEARADQAPVVAPLPMSTAQAPQQCCRMCQKGKPCGDGCISAERQCRKEQGCACAAGPGDG